MPAAWADALSVLRAPLGIYSILGNHDWWHGPVPGMPGGPEEVRRALAGIGVKVLENRRRPRSTKAASGSGSPAWPTRWPTATRRAGRSGADDLAGTLAQIRDDAPVIMLAHEPFVFRPDARPGLADAVRATRMADRS